MATDEGEPDEVVQVPQDAVGVHDRRAAGLRSRRGHHHRDRGSGSGGPPPRRHAIQSDLTPSSSHGGVAVRGVINAVGSIKCENVGDIGIEATITENGVDVAQRRLRCVAADQCKTTVKTSFELGKKYCVRVFVASQPFPAIPGVALEADKSTFCETWDMGQARLPDHDRVAAVWGLTA